jgi:hypothetical protein
MIKGKNEVEIENLISKITSFDGAIIRDLEWLSQNENNSLQDYSLTELVRYLLKKTVELEKRIEELTTHQSEG